MIGYYVHHHGRGHLSRALAIAAALDVEVTILSSLPRAAEWRGSWIALPLDLADDPEDADARGRLHWVPVHSEGLRRRMSAIAAWIDAAEPRAFVVDVSVEVALLARLHGVPVITVAVPGGRDDPGHALGFGVSSAVIGSWPPAATEMIDGLTPDVRARLHPVGAIARHRPPISPPVVRGDRPRVLVISGAGGDDFSRVLSDHGQAWAPGWEWAHVGGSSGRWTDDPWGEMRSADVVVTHAGEGILAEVAAARRPAIVIPQDRPHAEQATTGRALAGASWPVIVIAAAVQRDWPMLLDSAARLDGDDWRTWNDGHGAARAAAVIERVIAHERAGP